MKLCILIDIWIEKADFELIASVTCLRDSDVTFQLKQFFCSNTFELWNVQFVHSKTSLWIDNTFIYNRR